MGDQQRELEEARKAIEKLDDGILAALAERAALSKKMPALLGDEAGYAPKRERDLLERIDQKGAGEFPKRALAHVFREIASACFTLEAPLRVSYEGPPGSLAHEAARKRFGVSAVFLPCEGPRATLELVEREHADVGVVVLESSIEGLLQPALDALAEANVKIVGEIESDVRVHLLNKSGQIGDVERVFTSAEGRTAAARFLATNLPRAEVVETATAEIAAQMAAADPKAAALGGGTLGEGHELVIARGNVGDLHGEHVRCGITSARPTSRTGHDSTSFVITLDDAPGALFRVLKPLADRDLNLRRIQSRPRAHGEQDGSRTYRFFVEVAGHVTDRPLVTAFDEIKRSVRQLKILGSYPSKS